MSIDLHTTEIGLANLEFKLGQTTFPVKNLALKITKQMNNHTKVWFSLPPGEAKTGQKQSDYFQEILANTALEVNLINLPQPKNSKSKSEDDNQPYICF